MIAPCLLVGLDVCHREVRGETLSAVQAKNLVVEPAGKGSIEDDQWFVGDIFQS